MKHIYQNFDTAAIIAKVLYLGMFTNILLPGLLLAGCYYVTNDYFLTNEIGDLANTLFYVFGAMAIGQAGVAIWWRGKKYNQPMIRKADTFETDLAVGLVRASRPVFLLIASISIYGYAYFLMTGRFQECLFLVLISFLAFQVVRPRYGTMRTIIDRQMALVEKGRFAPSQLES